MEIKRRRKNIAVLIDYFEGSFQNKLCKAFQDFVKERDLNLFIFLGRSLESNLYDDSEYNSVYELAFSPQIDGIIISSSLIFNHIEQTDQLKFIRRLLPMPVVLLSGKIKGIPSVVCDNAGGMRELTRHFIVSHGYRSIAFVRGPADNPEAEYRFNAFKEEISAAGIPLEDKWIIEGDFLYESGRKAAQKLFSEAKFPEAVIASNDVMAMGVIDYLNSIGLEVPLNVAVAGFDDIRESLFTNPPLTTVRQSLTDLARVSGEILLKLINGNSVPGLTRLPAELVIRESCSCSSIIHRDSRYFHSYFSMAAEGFDNFGWSAGSPVREIMKILDLSSYESEKLSDNIARLVDLTKPPLSVDGRKTFVRILANILRKIPHYYDSYSRWEDVLFYIKKRTEKLESSESVNEFFDHIFLTFSQIMQSWYLKKESAMDHSLWYLRGINRRIYTSMNLEELGNVLYRELSDLGFQFNFVSIYREPVVRKAPFYWEFSETSEILYLKGIQGDDVLPLSGRIYQTRQILPPDLLKCEKCLTIILQPLFNFKEQFGFIGLSLENISPQVYGILREQISNSLNNIKIYSQKSDLEKKLREAIEDIRLREEKFREIAQLLPTIIIETDMLMNITYLNLAGLELFGLKEEDNRIPGISIRSLIHPDDRDKLDRYESRIMHGEAPLYDEFRLFPADGGKITLLSKASPIFRDGRPFGIRWSAIDLKPIFSSFLSPDENAGREYRLSKREKEIFNLFIQGYRSKEIAEKLFISDSTVKAHISSIYAKMSVNNKAELYEKLQKDEINRIGYGSFLFYILSKYNKNDGIS